MRGPRRTALLLALAVLLPALGRTQPTPQPETVPDLDDPAVQACIVEALSPAALVAPDHCSWGIWLPAPVYQDLHRWNLVGKDCDRLQAVARVKERQHWEPRLQEASQKLDLTRIEADRLREAADPSLWRQVLNVGIGGLAGGGLGVIGGLAAAAVPQVDLEWGEGALVGGVVGLVAGVVGGVVVELLR